MSPGDLLLKNTLFHGAPLLQITGLQAQLMYTFVKIISICLPPSAAVLPERWLPVAWHDVACVFKGFAMTHQIIIDSSTGKLKLVFTGAVTTEQSDQFPHKS